MRSDPGCDFDPKYLSKFTGVELYHAPGSKNRSEPYLLG